MGLISRVSSRTYSYEKSMSNWTAVSNPNTSTPLYKHKTQGILLDRDPELLKNHKNVVAAIDTNALIGDKVVLFSLIKSHGNVTFCIPQAVVDELDGKKKAKKGNTNKHNKMVLQLQEFPNFEVQSREHLLGIRGKYGEDKVVDNEILACAIELKMTHQNKIIFL